MTSRPLVAALAAASYLGAAPPAALAQSAAGDPATEGHERSPWARGVSAEEQQAANALFREGNALLRDSFFVQAAEKYREAIGHWDHPAIHYNLALALINLDQPLEVHASLERAVAYGPAALDQEKLELAENYKRLIEQQLARVTIACQQDGARVSLDGKEALTCPGQVERRVRSGEHTITASKPGYETRTVTRFFTGGQAETVSLTLYRPEELTGYRRTLPAWLPWAVAGAGVAVAGAGGLLHASARDSYREFDSWASDCFRAGGMEAACTIDSQARELLSTGDQRQTLAFAAYGLGAAAVVTGIVLGVINRPRPYRLEAEHLEAGGLSVTPVLGADRVGLAAGFRF
jgi:tetratricopeptide (TPR) repeat protein